jgi:diguanylate cyclase (GGDEF)-like protein
MSSDARSDLAALRELTERLSQGAPLERALHEVTDTAVRVLPADHASIRVLDASRTLLLAAARSGAGSDEPSLPLAKGEGVAGWVMEHGVPAHIKNVKTDRRFVVAVGQGFRIGSMLVEPLLSAGDPIGVLSISSPTPEAFSEDDASLARILANCSVPQIEKARLERLAASDELTLAYSARMLAPRLAEEMDRARHSGSPLSVLIMDLDHLARVNEAFGRPFGDRVLSIFAERVRGLVRRYDTFVRASGDEFVLVLPTTNPTQAQTTAERVRKTVGDVAMEPRPGGPITQTLSHGIATWNGKETGDALLGRARDGVGDAKRRGGNAIARGPLPKE